jgi:hypothetical protein
MIRSTHELRGAAARSTVMLAWATALVGGLGACTTAQPPSVVAAATSPLTDLNLLQIQIPPALQAAQKAPYAVPAEPGCTPLAQEIQALDEVLGPDLDAPATDGDPGVIERGTQAVGSAALGALRRTTEGLVPFRGWVRKLTGAEAHSREAAAAVAAGVVRRAFLKGLKVARTCG